MDEAIAAAVAGEHPGEERHSGGVSEGGGQGGAAGLGHGGAAGLELEAVLEGWVGDAGT